jgi:hypothetical protein
MIPQTSGTAADDNNRQREELRYVDVVIGQCHDENLHSGNRYFHQLVEQYATQYNQTMSRNIQSHVVRRIIQKIANRHGRFVKLDRLSNHFHPVSQAKAVKKVTQALRYLGRRRNYQYVQQLNMTTTTNTTTNSNSVITRTPNETPATTFAELHPPMISFQDGDDYIDDSDTIDSHASIRGAPPSRPADITTRLGMLSVAYNDAIVRLANGNPDANHTLLLDDLEFHTEDEMNAETTRVTTVSPHALKQRYGRCGTR